MADQQAQALQPGTGRSENLPFTYASIVQFASSPWDLKILFGDTTIVPTTGESVVKHHTGITLSWQQAKVALLFLHMNINIYERDHGEIKIPKLAFSSAVQARIAEPYVTFDEAFQAIKEAIAEGAPGGEEGKSPS